MENFVNCLLHCGNRSICNSRNYVVNNGFITKIHWQQKTVHVVVKVKVVFRFIYSSLCCQIPFEFMEIRIQVFCLKLFSHDSNDVVCVCVLACAFVLFLGEYFDKAGFTWRTKIKGRILYKTVTRMKKIEFSEWETSYFQNEKLLCLLKAFPMGSIHLKEEKKCCQTSLSSLCMAIDMTNFWLFVILNLNLYSISTVLCSEYCFFAVHGLWW